MITPLALVGLHFKISHSIYALFQSVHFFLMDGFDCLELFLITVIRRTNDPSTYSLLYIVTDTLLSQLLLCEDQLSLLLGQNIQL